MPYEAPPGGFRTFVIVWVSQSVSVFGSAMTYFAINIWLVQSVYPRPEQRAELAWALAALGLALALPAVVATPVAGALADRLDRKRLMLATDLANGVLMALTAYLMAAGHLEFWALLAIAALLSATGAVHGSAFDTSYAMLVRDDQLPRANGMMQTMWSLAAVLAPAAAATLVALPALARQGFLTGAAGGLLERVREGAALAIAIDAATFFLAAAVLAFLFIPSPKRADLNGSGDKRPSIWADVRFGIVYIRRRPPLLWLLGTFAVANLCLPLGVFMPLLVKVDLARDWAARGFSYETALAFVNTLMAAGGIAGGALVSLWGGLKRRRYIGLMLALAAGGVAMIFMGFAGAIYVAAASAFLFDFTMPIGNAHSQAIWQTQVPRELQGRVFAVRRVIAQGLSPLSQVMAGWLAGVLDPGAGLAMLGGIIAVVSIAQLFNPQVRRVEDTAYLNQMAG